MTETKIIERLLAREPDVLAELERQYGRYCAAIAAGLLEDAADVEEVVGDVWMQVWSSIPPNRPAHLRLYVGRIARNLALNRLDYLRAEKRAAVPLEELSAVTPDRNLERQALKDALERFLHSVKPEYRQMFLRRYWYGDGVQEIAARFGCTRVRVSGILFRLRGQLREFLKKEEVYHEGI